MRRYVFLLGMALFGAGMLSLALALSGLGEWLEHRTLDLRFRMRQPPTESSPVTLVVLRGEHVQRDDQPLRDHLAAFLLTLATLPPPRAVVVDIRLALPDKPSREGAETSTQQIIRATQALGTVVHAFDLPLGEHDFRSPDGAAQLKSHVQSWPTRQHLPPLQPPDARAAHASFGHALFGAAAGAGFTNVWPPPRDADRTVYALQLMAPLLMEEGFNVAQGVPTYPSLALAGAEQALHGGAANPACRSIPASRLVHEQHLAELPLQSDGTYPINFRPRFGFDLAMPESPALSLRMVQGQVPPEVLLFHYCTPEADAPGDDTHEGDCDATLPWFSLKDGTPIPLEALQRWLPCQSLVVMDGHEQNAVLTPLGTHYPQASLHAQVMSNLLEDDPLRTLPEFAPWVLGMSLALLGSLLRVAGKRASQPDTSYSFGRLRRFGRWAPAAMSVRNTLWTSEAALACLWSLGSAWVFSRWSLALPVALPLGALAGHQLGWRAMDRFQLERELRKLSALEASRNQAETELHHQLSALTLKLEEQEAQRMRLEASLEASRHELEEVQHSVEEAQVWAREAGAGLERLSSQHEQALQQASDAHQHRLTLLHQLEAAQTSAEVTSLELALQQAQDNAEASRVEAAGLHEALEEARTLATLAATQAAAAEEARKAAEKRAAEAEEALSTGASLPPEQREMAERVDLALIEAMQLSGRLVKPVGRLKQLLSAAEAERTPQLAPLLASGEQLREGVKKLKGLSDAMSSQGPTLELVRNRLMERQVVYRSALEHVQSVLAAAGTFLERVAPPEAAQSDASETVSPPRRVSDDFITTDPHLVQLFEKDIPRLARSDMPVLILGETGTGKELVARALHRHSGRAGKLKDINCAAIPEQLLEAELFGHVKGAFTGAVADRRGLCEEAHNGTLFLDELGRLPGSLQAKLLRVLDNGKIRRLGSNTDVEVKFRLLAATSTNLEAQVRDGHFLQDLYFRIKGLVVELPPLRQRRGDISFLARMFLRLEAEETRRELRWTPEALAALNAWTWPGNVRELKTTVRALVVLAPGDTLDAALVWSQLEVADASSAALQDFTAQEQSRLALLRRLDFDPARCARDPAYHASKSTADRHIRVLICKALLLRQWDVGAAARLLAGSDGSALVPVVQRRIRHFLGENLLQNLERARNAGDAEEASRRWEESLRDQYRAEYPLIESTVRALREGRLTGFADASVPPTEETA